MSFDLYYVPPSAPCRSVLFVGKELDINFNLKLLNLMEKEQLKPEFLAVSLTLIPGAETAVCLSPLLSPSAPYDAHSRPAYVLRAVPVLFSSFCRTIASCLTHSSHLPLSFPPFLDIDLQINPQHCVPTLVDNDEGGFSLWESRSIVTYLVDKVSPGHSLYPTDLQTRATINRWLYWDLGSLYPALSPILYPVLMRGEAIDESKVPALKDKLKILDDALDGKKYVVGDNRTLADLVLLVTVTTLEVLEKLDTSEFANIKTWADGLKEELPYYQEINQSGIDALKAWGASKKNSMMT